MSKTLRAATATALAIGVIEPTLGWTLLEAPFLVLLLLGTASVVGAFCTVGAVVPPSSPNSYFCFAYEHCPYSHLRCCYSPCCRD